MLEHLSKMGEVMGLIPSEREGDGEEERKRQRHGRTPLEDTEAWIMDLPAKICSRPPAAPEAGRHCPSKLGS